MTDQLVRLERWLGTHAPETAAAAHPPATPSDIADAETTLGFPLPNAVHRLYLWHDGGASRSHDALWLTPEFGFMSLHTALTDWAMRGEIAEEEFGPDWREEADFYWNERWFPIGTSWTGDLLVVDCSDSPTQGQVTIAGNEGPMGSDPTWPHLDVLLQQLADALESGTALHDHTPVIQDGRLAWLPQENSE
ncbi:SMI1/KNR4 family protein [Krasilnikovia sp. M28-CT-15]|uniref:SMI1/KNR4 family protein n=1 Tax=Krasilnikovia sp. M28-CT-15 TaxID=3373540 RepID=UPI003877207A